MGVAGVAVIALSGAVLWDFDRKTDRATAGLDTTPPTSTTSTTVAESGSGPVWAVQDGSRYTLAYRLDGKRWWSIDLTATSDYPGNFLLHQLGQSAVVTGNPKALSEDGYVETLDVPSAYEYALTVADQGPDTLVGNIHGYEEQVDIVATLDGKPIGDTVAQGRRIVVTRDSILHRPSDGSRLANVETTYRMTKDGLRVSWRMDWLADADVTLFYPAMFPVSEEFTSGRIGGETVDLTRGQGSVDEVHLPVATASVLSDRGLKATLTVEDPEVSLNGWRNTDPAGQTFIQDRAGNDLNKIYTTRVSPASGPVQVTAGTAWESAALYTVK